jgi:hypothetical protein
MVAEREDVWASGDAYESYVRRWSREVLAKKLNVTSMTEVLNLSACKRKSRSTQVADNGIPPSK